MLFAKRKAVLPVAKGRDLAKVSSSPANPEKTGEVRIGLVMYGGVSLAIYINGVAHEFFRAVHGNGVYKLLKRLIDADIVVDIISGTSAGGINGIFLGYALTNGKDFSTMAKLWREHGDIARLLHDPDALPKPCVSLLNSEDYYHKKLAEAFAEMPAYGEQPLGDEPSAFDELDLFVTSTDFDGRVYTTYDDAGHPIEVKDHRAVFMLKHRDGRKMPFAPQQDSTEDPKIEALARMSRATSCFPAAFQPVKVAKGGSDGSPAADEILREWGKLDRNRDTYFLDGGVLDNKPFTYTTNEIFRRTATRPVERYLFYVEPDPERYCANRKLQEQTPAVLASALAGTVGIPGYESIADDLKLIARQNATLQHYNALRDGIIEGFLQPLANGGDSKRVAEAHRTTRLTQLARRAVRGIVKEDSDEQKAADDTAPTLDQRREAAKLLFDGFNAFPSVIPGETGNATLRDFDIYYRERRVALIISYVYGKVRDRAKSIRGVHALSASALHELNDFSKLLEIVRFNMEKLVDERQFDWIERDKKTDLWTDVQRLFQWLLNIDPTMRELKEASSVTVPVAVPADGDAYSRGVRDGIHKVLCERVTKWMSAPLPISTAPQSFHSLLRVLDDYGDALIARLANALPVHGQQVRALWDNFNEADALLFPLQVLSGVGEVSEIRTIRISPYDAQLGFSEGDPKKKVAGDDLAHFSGFFKKSWRSNDILVGRLDGACQIIETLLCEERMKDLFATKETAGTIRALLVGQRANAVADDFGSLLKEVFPRSSDKARRATALWLHSLTSCDDEVRAKARHGEQRQEGLAHLVSLAQFEILAEELPNVAEDQVSEDLEWKGVPSLKRSADARNAFDEMRARANEPYDEPTPLASRLAKTYATESSYGVGGESIKNITPIVLLETVMNAMLVAKTALMESLTPSLARSIEAKLIYRFFIDLPLRIGRRLVVAIRREPKLSVVFLTAFVTASAVLLAGVYLWPHKLLYESGTGIQWLRVWGMLLVPIIGLSVISHITLQRRVRAFVRWSVAIIAALMIGWWLKDYSISVNHRKATVWQFPADHASVVAGKR